MPWTMTRAEKRYDKAVKKAFHAKYGKRKKKRKSKWWPGKFNGPRQSVEYYNWRQAVLKRDGKICCRCGETKGVFHIHHIMSFYYNPELRYDIDNGEVWCMVCHNTYHCGLKN